MEHWKYVKKDGNPKKEGLYWVTLIYPVWKDQTKKYVATVGTRYFGDAKANASWKMEDQPDEGLVWTEECGSNEGEYVHAWMPIEEVPMADLPDGVEKDEDYQN